MARGAAIFWVNKEFSGNHTEVGAGIFCPNAEFRGHGKAGGADILGVNKDFSGYGMARGTDFFASKEFSCNGEAQFLVLPTKDFVGSGDSLLPCDLGRFPSWGLGGMILELIIRMVEVDGAMLSIQSIQLT